jgi:hypothetical protein
VAAGSAALVVACKWHIICASATSLEALKASRQPLKLRVLSCEVLVGFKVWRQEAAVWLLEEQRWSRPVDGCASA